MTRHHTTVGLEIEYHGGWADPLNNIREAGVANGLPSLANMVDEHGRYHTTFHSDRWIIGYDGTVDHEIKSHPLRDTSEVEHVMRGIKAGGGRVSRACGLHVHVGIGHLTVSQIKRLAKVFLRYENALDNLLPRSRRANQSQWCYSNLRHVLRFERSAWRRFGNETDLSEVHAGIDGAANVQELSRMMQSCRESKFNLYPYESKTTVEFRGHGGTLNYRKIDAWIALLVEMVRMAEGHEDIPANCATFEQMLDELVPNTSAPTRTTPRSEPREGTNAARIWALCDRLLEAHHAAAPVESCSLFMAAASTGSGFKVRNQRVLRDVCMAQLGTKEGTTRGSVHFWAQTRGLTNRPTASRSTLRSYLASRARTLGYVAPTAN